MNWFCLATEARFRQSRRREDANVMRLIGSCASRPRRATARKVCQASTPQYGKTVAPRARGTTRFEMPST